MLAIILSIELTFIIIAVSIVNATVTAYHRQQLKTLKESKILLSEGRLRYEKLLSVICDNSQLEEDVDDNDFM